MSLCIAGRGGAARAMTVAQGRGKKKIGPKEKAEGNSMSLEKRQKGLEGKIRAGLELAGLGGGRVGRLDQQTERKEVNRARLL